MREAGKCSRESLVSRAKGKEERKGKVSMGRKTKF